MGTAAHNKPSSGGRGRAREAQKIIWWRPSTPKTEPIADVQRGHPNSARPRRKPGGVVGNAIRNSARRERIGGAHPRRLGGSNCRSCAAAARLVVPNANVEVFIDFFAERPGVRASGAGPAVWTARSGDMCTHEPLANARATDAARDSVRLPGRHHVFRQNDRISESDKEEAATARSSRRRAAPSSSMSQMRPGCTAPAGGGRRGAVGPAAHTAPRSGKKGGGAGNRATWYLLARCCTSAVDRDSPHQC